VAPARHQCQHFTQGGVADGQRRVQRLAAAVVGAQVQTHSQAEDLYAAARFLLVHHLAQMVVEVKRVIGQMRGGVHWAAV
jgi:hypothetical protein